MGKRSPRDTTPPDRIIDWENEAERAFIEMPVAGEAERWYDLKENAAALREDFLKDDFFSAPAAKPEGLKEGELQPDGHYWWPSLSPRFGLRMLPYDMRQETLRTEGLAFRKKYNEGARRVGTPREFFNIPEEDVEFFNAQDDDWLNNIYTFPESDRSQFNCGLPGSLTAEGFRLMDGLPITPVVEEFDDLPISGAVFWLMKRSHKARLERLRKKREAEEN